MIVQLLDSNTILNESERKSRNTSQSRSLACWRKIWECGKTRAKIKWDATWSRAWRILCRLCSKIITIFLESIQEMHRPQHCQELFSERIQTKILHKRYCSMVGKLLYFVKKVGPVCAIACWELFQHLENQGEAYWSAVERLLGFITTDERNRIL